MPSAPNFCHRPDLSTAPLLKELGGTRVFRLGEIGDYFIDWVVFRPGNVTPVHKHPGVEHHLVVQGEVLCRYEEIDDTLKSGEYAFWDGRKPHTSYATEKGAASMLIVRGSNKRPPSTNYVVSKKHELSFHDGIQQSSVKMNCRNQTIAGGRMFVAVPTSHGVTGIDGKYCSFYSDYPLLFGRTAQDTTQTIEGSAIFTILEFTP